MRSVLWILTTKKKNAALPFSPKTRPLTGKLIASYRRHARPRRFGGEVERVLSMVDSVLLLVDAVDGPMPQTRFVTAKAFERGLNPIVVVNKIDRVGARPDWVINQVFDLFDRLGATEEQLDFPVIYTSALNGVAGLTAGKSANDMTPLFEMITRQVPCPDVNVDAPFQMQISALDYNSYVGVIGIGRITRGHLSPNFIP